MTIYLIVRGDILNWKERDIQLWRDGKTWGEIVEILTDEYPSETFNKDKVREPIRPLDEYKERQHRELNSVLPHRKTVIINQDGSRQSDNIIIANDEQISDVEYLLKAHGFRNTEEWEVLYVKNSIYNVQIKGGNTDTYYASKITVKPSKNISQQFMLDYFLEEAQKYSPVKPRIVKTNGENILLINVTDLHLGQLSWGLESGENYDNKIAAERFRSLITDIIRKSPYGEYEKVVIIFGNDFFNTDTVGNTTTAGTQQTNDVRHQKMYKKGCELMTWGVDTLREYFSTTPIEVLLVPGYHDTMMAYHAAMHLYAWFRNDNTVTIDTSPAPYKGFAYGVTALLFTHGKNELKNLDWVYTKFRHLIGITKHTEIHAGHKHSIKVEEKNGALIRVNPSPAALSGWASAEGYGSIAQTISRVYNKDTGLEYEIYSRVKESEGI